MNRHNDAEPLFLKAIEAKRRVVGDEHPDTCVTLSRLASMYITQRRYRDAEPVALAAYQGYVNRLGDDHASTRGALDQLVNLYTSAGERDTADRWRAKLRSK